MTCRQRGRAVVDLGRTEIGRCLPNGQRACRDSDIAIVGIGVAACHGIGIATRIGAGDARTIPRHDRRNIRRVRALKARRREPADGLCQAAIGGREVTAGERHQTRVGIDRDAIMTGVARQTGQGVITC